MISSSSDIVFELLTWSSITNNDQSDGNQIWQTKILLSGHTTKQSWINIKTNEQNIGTLRFRKLSD